MSKPGTEKKPRGIDDEDLLPPLDDDELGTVDTDELVGYLDVENDGDGAVVVVVEESFIDEADLFSIDALPGGTETSLEDKDDDVQQMEGIDLAIDDEEGGWSNEESDSPLTMDDEWFVDGDDRVEVSDDGGAEGPIGEDVFDFETEPADWKSLDEDIDKDEEDEILDTMARLGIELPTYNTGELGAIGGSKSGLLLDCTVLGPRDDVVIAAAFDSGSPLALGDGLFVLGADGMLHLKVGSERLGRMVPTSLCIHDPHIFMGTECGGVVRTRDRGDSYTPLNSWYTRGLSGGEEVVSDRISTSAHLIGQDLKNYRLVVWTDEGQLFVSDDLGDSWRGPLLSDRCVAVGEVGGTKKLLALIRKPQGEMVITASRDLNTWLEQPIPSEIVTDAQHGQVSLAASGDTVVISARDASMPAYISQDRGASWTEVGGVENVTALAIDPEDSTWMVAATYDPNIDQGMVYMSDDSGRSWQTILRAENDNAEIQAVSNRQARHMNCISDLVVDIGRTRQILVVTAGGIYLATLARPGGAH